MSNKYNNQNLKNVGGRQLGAWFPIKSHRYDTSKHPIVTGKANARRTLKFPVSIQEAQLLEGLTNTLQVDQQTALRIALYEACKRPQEAADVVQLASPTSTVKGHTQRNTSVVEKITADEAKALKSLAKSLGISEKAAARLSLIWMAKGTRSDRKEWKKFSGCKKLGQDAIANQWQADKKTSGEWVKDGGSVEMLRLREAHRDALDEGMAENDALYDARGEMASHLVQQGLSALVYPNKLEARLFPEEYAGLDHIANQMDTDFVDRMIAEKEGDTCPWENDPEVLAAMAEEDEELKLTDQEMEEMEELAEQAFQSFSNIDKPILTNDPYFKRMQEEGERLSAAKDKMDQAIKLIDEGDELAGIILALGEEECRRRGLIE
nr:hypothetical protein 15 [bacterium]